MDPRAQRDEVTRAALAEVGRSDPARYWSAVNPPDGECLAREWSGPFALWCLRAASLVYWLWQPGPGFLHQLELVHRPDRVFPGDLIYLHRLDRTAVAIRREPDGVLLVLGNGKGGRVTMQLAAPSVLQFVYPIDPLLEVPK